MKQEELRIGNLIQWEDDSNDIVQVTGISFDHDEYFVSYKETTRNEKGDALLSEFIPIPLTEEWLIKFGFKQDSDLKNSLCKNGIWFNKVNMEATYLSQKLIKIKYVHQLQNLYFALTGEELKVL